MSQEDSSKIKQHRDNIYQFTSQEDDNKFIFARDKLQEIVAVEGYNKLAILQIFLGLGLHQRCSESKNEGNRMSPVNSNDYYSWADTMETFSRLGIIACLFIVILHRKYSQRYDKNTDYIVNIIACSTGVIAQFCFPY